MNKELKNILGGFLAAFLIYLAHAFAEANFNIAYWGDGIRYGCSFFMLLAFIAVYMVQKGGEEDIV